MPLAVPVDSLQVKGWTGCSRALCGLAARPLGLMEGRAASAQSCSGDSALCSARGTHGGQGAPCREGHGSGLCKDADIANITQQFIIRMARADTWNIWYFSQCISSENCWLNIAEDGF